MLRLVKPRALRLIRKDHAWAICFKAAGKLEDRPGKIIAWLRDHDEAFFCEVGEESQCMDLPGPSKRNFFDDQFTFAIDETDEKGGRISYLGGANNVNAATAAFHVYLKDKPNRHIMLRQGARILLRGHDLKIQE